MKKTPTKPCMKCKKSIHKGALCRDCAHTWAQEQYRNSSRPFKLTTGAVRPMSVREVIAILDRKREQIRPQILGCKALKPLSNQVG